MTARPPGPQRLVDAYLQDLERVLSPLVVDERRDVVDSVREHIDAALDERGDDPTTADVEDVLRQLGPVEHIAHDVDSGSAPAPFVVRNPGGGHDPPSAAAGYLLAALIVGMAVSASLLLYRIPPFFSEEGGDPVVAGQLTFVFIVFAVAARIVKRNRHLPR